jgi:hypothetical protein
MSRLTALLLLVWTIGSLPMRAQQAPKPAVRLDPVTAILDAFQTHPLVGFPGGHPNGNEVMALLRTLVRHPRFAETVNDIVVEFGTSRYQDLMDRYIRGDDVPDTAVRRAWLDAVQAGIALDNDNTAAFFRTVREVNAALAPTRRIRVLLGDPPMDWDNIRDRMDFRKWVVQRDSYPAALVQREVLARNRRALLVYAPGHLLRKEILSNYDMSDWQVQTIVSLLERDGRTSVFTMRLGGPMTQWQPDTASWPVPSLTIVRGTVLGAPDFDDYENASQRYVIRGVDDFVPLPREQWAKLRMEDQYDAILYMGPQSARTSAPISSALCADPAYIKMRLDRIAMVGLPPGEGDAVRRACGVDRSPDQVPANSPESDETLHVRQSLQFSIDVLDQ